MIPEHELPAILDAADEHLEALARHNERNSLVETLTHALAFESAPSAAERFEAAIREAINRIDQGAPGLARNVLYHALRHK